MTIYKDPQGRVNDNGEYLVYNPLSIYEEGTIKIRKDRCVVRLRNSLYYKLKGRRFDADIYETLLKSASEKEIACIEREMKYRKSIAKCFSNVWDDFLFDFISFVLKSELFYEYHRLWDLTIEDGHDNDYEAFILRAIQNPEEDGEETEQ